MYTYEVYKNGNRKLNKTESRQIRRQHIAAFLKLDLTERLSWALSQGQFLARFMDAKAKRTNRLVRQNGKKYFKKTNLG